jgi:type VI secretion system Hcp family effector
MNTRSKSFPFRGLSSFLPAVLLLLIFSISTVCCFGQEKFFLKIDDIKGGSTSATHKDQIDVLSWSWGLAPSGGTIPSKPVSGALTFEMEASVASPVLMQKSAKGVPLLKAELMGYRLEKGELRHFMTITLQDIRVSAFSTRGIDKSALQAAGRNSTDASVQIETVSLTFAKIEYAFGTTKAGYDFAANKALVASPGGAVTLASVKEPSTVGSDSLKILLHADASSPLQLTTETRGGKQYLAVEVARSKDSQTLQLVTQVSKDLETWSAGTVIEEVAQDEPAQQIIRYLIPIDQAQQFLRVSTQ